ncbi:MAG: hypothetical protein NTV34_07470, partial [Proteobacteria bacterium]|nr:hypothetical protein [Pseudomonadota bacterium]
LRAIKSLLDRLRGDQFPQSDVTQQAISKARSGAEGQAGLAAFFNKTSAPWLASIPNQLVPDASSLPLT